jgi:hypothetical protein
MCVNGDIDCLPSSDGIVHEVLITHRFTQWAYISLCVFIPNPSPEQRTMTNTPPAPHTQPCCILSHLDPSRTRYPLPGFCEHGLCCTAQSKTESSNNVVISTSATGQVYDTRDAKTVLERIKREIEVEEREWLCYSGWSVGSR